MVRVVWTPQAIADVEAIRDYIIRDSPRYGAMVVEQIVRVVERLKEYPLSGRRVPERRIAELRELLCGNYRIVYRVVDDHVDVLTVFHGARLVRIPWEIREVRRAS